MRIPLAPSGLREVDIQAVINSLRSGNLTMGEEVKSFESEMAEYLGVKHFVMVNSGSSANLAMVEALLRPTNVEPKLAFGDEVLVPSIAWPTTIWPLIQLGLKPVFVDVEPDSMAIDLSQAQRLIDTNLKAKAIFPIHVLGLGINRELLEDFVEKNNLILIEDVCESLGSWQKGFHSGTSGVMSSFSFYFSHHLTTMEGGGIATNDSRVADDLRSIRSHGWSRDRSDNFRWSFEVHPSMQKFNFVSTGYNIRPMEIQAAVGRTQLRDLETFIDKRRRNVARIKKSIEGTGLQILSLGQHDDVLSRKDHSWMHVPIRVKRKPGKSNDSRAKIVRFLEDFGIETRPPLTGNFLRQPAMDKFNSNGNIRSFEVSDDISQNTFLVGCHHDLTEQQVEYLAEKLRLAAINLL